MSLRDEQTVQVNDPKSEQTLRRVYFTKLLKYSI